MKLRMVVAAIDLRDDLAEAVIAAADDLARRDGAALHVVEAWPVLTAAATGYTPEMAAGSAVQTQAVIDEDDRARELQEEALRKRVQARNPKAQIALLTGEPGDAVARYAREVDADIIVTGSHQRGFWSALFSGGGAREVVREAPCAVFLVTKPFAKKLAARNL